MTAKKAPQAELPELPPLSPCESWERAEALAREALAYILEDPHESGANRIKAAALILGRPGAETGNGETGLGSLEDWLREQPQKSHL